MRLGLKNVIQGGGYNKACLKIIHSTCLNSTSKINELFRCDCDNSLQLFKLTCKIALLRSNNNKSSASELKLETGKCRCKGELGWIGFGYWLLANYSY